MAMNTVNTYDGAITTIIDNTTSATYTYIGEASPGSSSAAGTAAPIWRISRITVANGTTEWASSKFDQIWDNRASLTYK